MRGKCGYRGPLMRKNEGQMGMGLAGELGDKQGLADIENTFF
jgi:hypothetical protein